MLAPAFPAVPSSGSGSQGLRPHHHAVLYPPVSTTSSKVQCGAGRHAVSIAGYESRNQQTAVMAPPRDKVAMHGTILAWKVMPSRQQQPQQQFIHPKALTAQIKACTRWEELLQVHRQRSGQMNHIHVSAMLTHLAQLQQHRVGKSQHQATQQGDGTPKVKPQDVNPGLNNNPHAAGIAGSGRRSKGQQLQQQQGPADEAGLVQSLLQQMVAQMHHMENRQVANSMWSAAKLGCPTPNQWVTRCMAAVRHTLHSSTPQQLSNTAYALALRPEWLDHMHSARAQWLDQLFSTCHAKLPQFRPQELSNLLWAAAHLHQYKALPLHGPTSACLMAALDAAVQRAGQLNAQEVSSVLWAAGKLTGQKGLARGMCSTKRPPAVVPQLRAAAAQWLLRKVQQSVTELRPEGLSAVMLSLPALGIRPSRAWVRGLLSVTTDLLPQSSGRELANTLLACAYLGYIPPSAWLSDWQEQVQLRLSSCTSQELANIAWAAQRLHCQLSKPFLAQLLMAAASRMPEFLPAELTMLIQALSKAWCKPDLAWMQLFCATVHDKMQQLTPEQLANILWSCARINFLPPQPWIAAALTQLQPQLPLASTQALAMVAYSLAMLGQLPEPAWCSALLDACERRLSNSNVRDLSSVLWAIAALDLRPSEKWMQVCLRRCTHLLQTQVHAQQQVLLDSTEHTVQGPAQQHPVASSELQAEQFQGTVPQGGAGTSQHADLVVPPSDTAVSSDMPGVYTMPAQFTAMQADRQRGGTLKFRARAAAASMLWGQRSLARTTWALARLGYATDHPLVLPFLRLASQVSTDHMEWQDRCGLYAQVMQPQDQVHAASSTYAAASTALQQHAAQQSARTQPAADAPHPQHLPSAPQQQLHKQVLEQTQPLPPQIDLDYLVLEGILDWSAARLQPASAAEPRRSRLSQVSVEMDAAPLPVP